MAKLPVAEIKKLALSIIADHPGGIRYSELVEQGVAAGLDSYNLSG